MLALVVPKLVSAGALQLSSDNDPLSEGLDSSSQVSMEIIGAFSKLELALKPADYGWDQLEPIAVIAWRYFDVVSSLLPACKPRFKDILYEHISSLVLAMATRCEVHGLATLIGKALGILSHMTPSAQIPRTGVSSTKLCDFIAAYGQNPAFLKGLVDYLKGVGVKTVNKEEIQRMTDISIQLLTSPGDEVRYLILSLLELLSQETMPSDIIRTAKMIEEIPFTLSNQRNVAMYVRKLGVDYSQAESNSWGRRMIPYYCFGNLSLFYAFESMLTYSYQV
jgi:U3 small nucleolar RNA-associated protein 20